MRVLIIGGTGLISTAITRYLVERGEDVTHYNRGQREQSVSGDIKHLRGDRNDYATFERQMQEQEPFDCVIDMICYEPEDAASDVRAFRGRTGHFILCSTIDVYTKPAQNYPIHEGMERKAIKGFEYAEKKVVCENTILEAHEQGAFPATIIRPAHTYGDWGAIIHSLGGRTTYLDRIRKGKPIIVHGDGQSLWGSCRAEDVGLAFANAAGQAHTFGKTYHVTGEEWQTWNLYHQRVAQAINAPAPTLVHIPTDLLWRVIPRYSHIVSVNFQFNNIFDNTAAHTDLGFRYTIPWLEGVQRVYATLDKHGRIENSDDDPTDDQVIAAWERLSNSMLQEFAVEQ